MSPALLSVTSRMPLGEWPSMGSSGESLDLPHPFHLLGKQSLWLEAVLDKLNQIIMKLRVTIANLKTKAILLIPPDLANEENEVGE